MQLLSTKFEIRRKGGCNAQLRPKKSNMFIKSQKIAAAIAVLTLTLGTGTLFAQTSRGTVTGSVIDPTGAVIANSEVTLLQKGTDVVRHTTTNGAGVYRFDSVLLGDYSLSAKAPGFNELKADIKVNAETVTGYDFKLTVGSSESIVVESNAVQLQSEDAVRIASIDARNLATLPIANQNSLNLILIVPGVVKSNQGGSLDSGIGSVNGSRARSNNFMIDGANNNDISVAGPAFTITNNDAIQEVSVQTSNFSAEFGRSGGAVVNQITKSGSNSLHGTAAEVYRSEIFNAASPTQRASYFEALAAKPAVTPVLKPTFKENIPAFTIGGPVVIPHLYNGRDKTFFFAAGQWDRFSSGASQATFTTPDAGGIATLQALAGTCPNVAKYLSVVTQQVAPSRSGSLSIELPANLASSSCGGGARTGQAVTFGTVTRSVPSLSLDNNHQVRIDHVVSDKQNMSFLWLYDYNTSTAQNIGLIPAFDSTFKGRTMDGVFNDTYVVSNTWTNEFRFSYERFNFGFPLADPKGLGSTLPDIFPGSGFSDIGVSATFPQGRVANSYQYQDTMALVRGKHTFRFGGEILRQLASQLAPFNGRGTLTYFDSSANAFVGPNTIPAFVNFIDDFSGSTGNGFANISFGSGRYRPNLFTWTLFFQDAWKVTPNLTLNAGLRYENFGQPANIFRFPAFTGFSDADAGSTARVNQDNNNFGPTIGFAYSPKWEKGAMGWLSGNGKAVIRGGFQTSYDTFYNNLLSNLAAGSPNAVTNPVVPGVSTASSPRGVANASNVLATAQPTPITPLSTYTSIFGKNIRNPYTDHWSLGVQREIPAGMVLDLAYVGGVSRDLFYTSQVNPTLPNATNTGTGARLFPNRGIIQTRDSGLNANYNSMQLQVRRGFRPTPVGQIGFSSSYTWSRNMDILSETFATNSGLQNPSVSPADHNLRLFDYGPSDNDRRHVWTTAMNWQLRGPKTGFLGETIGGWEVDPIVTLQSGTPFTPAEGIDRNLDGTTIGDRPDVGNMLAPLNTRAVQVGPAVCSSGLQNFDTKACVTANDVRWIEVSPGGQPSALTSSRNSVYTPGLVNVDMNILKTFNITERFKFEYRAEIFDLLNIRNFNVVPGSVTGTTKTLNSKNTFLSWAPERMATGNRTLRMGVKVIF